MTHLFQTTEELADGAALALCESLILSLIESGRLDPDEAHIAIEEAVKSLEFGVTDVGDPAVAAAAARLLERLTIGTNLEAARPVVRLSR